MSESGKPFRTVITWVAGFVMTLGGLVLAGWIFDIQFHKSVNAQWIPMKVPTALCLMCGAAALLAVDRGWNRRISQMLGIGVALAGLVSMAAYFRELQTGPEPAWFGTPIHMAPLTALIFIGFGSAFFFLGRPGPRSAAIAHAMVLPAALMSYLVLISYLFGVNALHTWWHVPVAVHTGLACAALSIGLFLVRPGTWFMRVLASPDAGGMIARRLLPTVLVVPLLIGGLRLAGERAGHIAQPVAAVLAIVANGLVMLWIMWLTARSANLMDERRRRTEAALDETRERYRVLVEMSPDAVFVNRDNRIVQVNRAALDLLRATSPDQVVGKSPFEIFHPDYHAVVRERIQTVLAGGNVPLIEEKVVRLDGTSCDVEVAASLFREQREFAVQVILRDITPRKQAEEALLRHREWLRVTLTSIGDAVLVTDAAGTITFLNPVAAELTGWKEDQALGRPVQEVFRIIHEKTQQPAEDIAGVVLREGRVLDLANHTALVTRDGRQIPIEDSAAPIRDGAGNVAGVVLVFHDVTAKRRAQEAIRREGEKLRQLNRTLKAHSRSDQALLLASDEAAYLREVCRIIVEDCGHTMVWVGMAEEDEARSVRPVARSGFEEGYLETLKISWADTERGRGPTGTAIRTGQVCACRNMLTDPLFQPWRAQALQRGYASSLVLPLISGGKAFGALTIYSREPDPFSEAEVNLLTELANDFAYGINVLRLRAAHAHAEQALRESESRFRTLAESIPHSVWVAEPGGRLEYFNQRFRKYRGLSGDAIYNWRVWKDGVHPDDLARAESAWDGLVRTGEDIAFEYRLHRAEDGVYRWQLGQGSAVRGGDGCVLRLIGTSTDIHDQKLAEEAVRQTQKLESIGVLAGGIAHDFNNLLVGVIGNASLAEEMLPPESPALDLLRRIIESGEQAAHLTRQMLAYAGKGRFIVKPVSLSAIAGESSALARSSISKKIDLRLQLDPGIPAVQSDPSQMQQVFMNLVVNAAEAIGGGPGVISVRTGVMEGRYVYLEVADNGCGMSEAVKAKIFDPFFTTKFQGRGLGLAAVAGIVRTHKGAIEVATAPGAGSTFRVLLPAMAASAAPDSAPAAVRRDDLRGEGTVLVVDDEELVRDVAGNSLRRQGYRVLVAGNGPEAVQIVRNEGPRIRLVILDLSMPGMSGEETLPHLRQLQPDLKVIVSSGYSEAEALGMFGGARVSGFIQKPYTAEELARKTKAALVTPPRSGAVS